MSESPAIRHVELTRLAAVVALALAVLCGTGCGARRPQAPSAEPPGAVVPPAATVPSATSPPSSPATTAPQTGTLEGFVVDGSAPMAGLLVQLIKDANTKYDATTDGAGFFAVKEVPEGEYLLNVVDYEALRQGHFRMRQMAVWIAPGKVLQVDLAFGVGARISGRVSRVPDGLITVIIARRPGGPAPEHVSPLDKDTQIQSAKFLAASAKVQDDGTYVLEDLEPGTYIVEVLQQQRTGESLTQFAERDRTPHARAEVTIADQDLTLDLDTD